MVFSHEGFLSFSFEPREGAAEGQGRRVQRSLLGSGEGGARGEASAHAGGGRGLEYGMDGKTLLEETREQISRSF